MPPTTKRFIGKAKMICKTEEQRKIWAAIERHIDDTPTDGINAKGVHSDVVAAQQRGIIQGLRIARLSAINTLSRRGVS